MFLYIRFLEVQNFRTLKFFSIEFTKGFNIIIGKNNTGKSNVLALLDKVYTDESVFEPFDPSTINNTKRLQPNFEIQTSINRIQKKGKYYYTGNSNTQKNREVFLKELNKINLIYIDIQKEYSNLIQTVIKEYGDLSEILETVYNSQINIEFSEVMGAGNSIFLKDESIYIIDEYADTSKIEYKSSGVQRVALIICIINLFKIKKKLSNYILLIDEPEGNLHAKAQKKMFNLLQNFSETHQVIISSHSTIFMQNLDFEAVNYIDRNKNKGSYVDNVNLGVNNFKKIRDALGLEISDTLFLNKHIIAVEGISDVTIHNYIYDRLYLENSNYTFFTIEGANNALQNVIALKQILSKEITLILDNDQKGREINNEIKGNNFVNQSRVIFQPLENSGELEDLFPKEFLKVTINSFIDKQRVTIEKKIGDGASEKIDEYRKKLEEFEAFSDVEIIGSTDNNYTLKNLSFIRYIRSTLRKQSNDEFNKTVNSFKQVYQQFL